MLIDLIDWIKVMNTVAKATKRTKKDIGREIGIAGNSLAAFNGSTTYPDPRHSEGERLLKLFREVTTDDIPTIKRSERVRCPSCTVLREREEIMRMNVQKFRCTTCVDNAEKRYRGK